MNESDMRNFFEQVVTNFVSLSQQAQELQSLKGEVGNLPVKLNDYYAENERINRSAHEAWELVTMLEKEKAEQHATITKMESEQAEFDQEITNQNNLIAQYSEAAHIANNKIDNLTAEVARLNETIADNRNEISRLDSTVNGLNYERYGIINDRDYWKRQYNVVNETVVNYQTRVTDLHNQLVEASDQLAKIKAVFMSSTAEVTATEPVSEPVQNDINL